MRPFKDQFSTGHIDAVDGLPDLTSKESSIVVAILSAGTFTGSMLSAPLADSILGRRFSMLVSSLVFCVGGILQTVAQELPMLLAGRYAMLPTCSRTYKFCYCTIAEKMLTADA